MEKFFVFGIVAQLGRQADHGLGNGALGESVHTFGFLGDDVGKVERLLSMAPAAQAEQQSPPEVAGKGWLCGRLAARFSPLNGAFAN